MSDRYVDFRFSKDGGYNWSNWRTASLGEEGAFNRRVVFRRLGAGRDWVFHIRVASPIKRDLIACSLDTASAVQ